MRNIRTVDELLTEIDPSHIRDGNTRHPSSSRVLIGEGCPKILYEDDAVVGLPPRKNSLGMIREYDGRRLYPSRQVGEDKRWFIDDSEGPLLVVQRPNGDVFICKYEDEILDLAETAIRFQQGKPIDPEDAARLAELVIKEHCSED